MVVDGDFIVVDGGFVVDWLGNSSSRFFPGFIFIWVMARAASNPVTNMLWFYGKKKSGFRNGTVTVPTRYAECTVTDFYLVDPQWIWCYRTR